MAGYRAPRDSPGGAVPPFGAPSGSDLVKAYNLFRKISGYPELMERMREQFLEVLVERGFATGSGVVETALSWLRADGIPDTEENRRLYRDAAIDLIFSRSLTPDEIENYVNLVRKKDKSQELGRVANNDHATPQSVVQALKEFCDIPKGELHIRPEEAEGIRVALISRFISNQLPLVGIAKKYVTIRDVDEIVAHMIGAVEYPGKLGGKAAGMIVAHRILLPLLEPGDPDLVKYMAVPDTWYISSGVFSDFIDRNSFYFAHTHKYRDREAMEEEYKHIGGMFQSASFPLDVISGFRRLIETIGEHPIIVRSSSFLEDSYGLAFSGKYQSVFLANRGDVDTRLEAFIRGVKQVLSSMYGPDPIIYRRDHGLLDYNERMAVIVQKVVGRRFGNYFFPFASGVMFSFNPYTWSPRIKKADGLVRLVFGLGTRAVDRVGDYPRMIPLGQPLLRPEATAEQIWRYSQKMVDAINLYTGDFGTVDFTSLAIETDHPDLPLAVSLLQEGRLSTPLFKTQALKGKRMCLTFENFLAKSPFVPLARKVLSVVQEAYGRPVDIEFAWDSDKLYLLQCRSLSIRRETQPVSIPTGVSLEDTLFVSSSGISGEIVANLRYIVYVNPRAYDGLSSFEEKRKIGWAVGTINKRIAGSRYALMGPGRWGSNDINLGVRVTYADINATKLLVEISFARDGYTPEVSYGTHFFQDLVEADIAVMPLYPDNPGNFLNESFLLGASNCLAALNPSLSDCGGVVHVIDVPSVTGGRYLHVYLDADSQRGTGIFAAQA